MPGAIVLEMRDITKRFPGVLALDSVNFDLRVGEIHALVGENGAGKSTLMKVLSGVYHPDGGQVVLQGQPVRIEDARHAQTLGIGIVHQELNLFPVLSITENILAGRQPGHGPLDFVDWQRGHARAREYMGLFDLHIDPATPVNRLSIAQQQVVEIARALSQNACILILDEPTSSLTDRESERLFETLDRLRSEGLCIVYISHRLEEIFRISDRITILRDGRTVDTVAAAETTMPDVIRMMVGRQVQDLFGAGDNTRAEEALRVEGLTLRGRYQDVSFTLHRGEILGMAGLIGAGRTDVARTIFGAQRADAGRIFLRGQEARITSPQMAMERGIAYLSENRRGDGLFLGMNVRENITVSHLPRFSRFGFMNGRRECEAVDSYVRQLRIQTPSLDQRVLNLSGGNQQKVILARWLAIEPTVLIVDEPTRGIDVGAKAEIYALLHRLAGQGIAILMISSDMPEVLGMSDRILVMHEGRITADLARREASEERIMTCASGQQAAPAAGRR